MNKKRNYYWLIAGVINLFTALLHTIGGQMDLVSPLQKSDMTNQAKAEWFGVWHMVTIILFASSFLILRSFVRKTQSETMNYLGYLYILLSIPFIISSLINDFLVPQWILLFPIGLLILIGQKNNK
jgi:hypothetical protein